MIKKEEFKKFLGYTIGAKDISLIIAHDSDEMKEFVMELKNEGYKYLKNILEAIDFAGNDGKGCFAMDDILAKDLYDFIVQYPTGQVQIWDGGKNDFRVLTPRYDGVSLVFLITKEDLENIKNQGFEILGKVGLTYQG